MAKTLAVVGAGVAGTLCMTAFSKMLSWIEQENFSEPHLLCQLFRQWGLTKMEKQAGAGWATHYAIGIGWVAGYEYLLKKGIIRDDALTGLAFGAGAGVIAAGAWKAMLATAKKKPDTRPGKFLWQLIPAHIVFGAVSLRTLKRLR